MDLYGRAVAREKGPKDLVTEADTSAQCVIRSILLAAYPSHDFLGEEDPVATEPDMSTGRRGSSFRWIVDPLDGTANYVHGLPGFAVSIGLERGGGLLAGVVFDPRLDECFVAALGSGAELNGKPLSVSACRSLRQAMVAASFPPNINRNSPEIPRFADVLVQSHSLRRLGSAALNLCYVAAGRLDAYWTTGCKVWDVAAGVLMVREAGGIITGIDGGPLELADPKLATAATAELHAEFLHVLSGRRRSPAGP